MISMKRCAEVYRTLGNRRAGGEESREGLTWRFTENVGRSVRRMGHRVAKHGGQGEMTADSELSLFFDLEAHNLGFLRTTT